MRHEYRQAAQKLYEIAEAQQGYFTAGQARSAGIRDSAHPYHVEAGNWLREWRGIYRLSRFPVSEDSYRVPWALWSRNREGTVLGVYSHETALAIHDLSDVNPVKLHMTVPPHFRRTARIPPVLILHKATLQPDECIDRWGYRVTRPLRTLVDILNEGTTSPEHVRAAITQSLERGLLTREEYRELENGTEHGGTLRALMGEAT